MDQRYSILVIILALFVLSGCGIKPDSLEPPDDNGQHFPRTYPNLSNDPDPNAQ